MEFLETLPEGYQRPNISMAAKIAGKNRSVLYRDYIKTGKITVTSDNQGEKFVPISELQRVFGVETCAQNIKSLSNIGNSDSKAAMQRFATPQETQETTLKNIEESVSLKIQNAQLATENEYLKKMLADQQNQTRQAEERERRIFDELTRSQLLLEDRRSQEEKHKAELAEIKALLDSKRAINNKPWWARLFR